MGRTPDRAASELTTVVLQSSPDESGLVEITGNFRVLLTPACAENLLAQLGAAKPLTRTAHLLWLLYAGHPEWIRDLRRSVKDTIRAAKAIGDSP